MKSYISAKFPIQGSCIAIKDSVLLASQLTLPRAYSYKLIHPSPFDDQSSKFGTVSWTTQVPSIAEPYLSFRCYPSKHIHETVPQLGRPHDPQLSNSPFL